MAEIIKEHEWHNGRGALTKYPWDEWVDGQIYHLVKDIDYTCTNLSMQTNLRDKARKLDMRVRTEISTEPIGLFFQFYKEDE